jgi:hypothetical protein
VWVHSGRARDIDLTLTMSGFDFETVWRERRSFRAEGVDIPVARLRHVVAPLNLCEVGKAPYTCRPGA